MGLQANEFRSRGAGVDAMEAMNLTIAITGASGAIFGRELLRALEAEQRESSITSAPWPERCAVGARLVSPAL